MKAIKEAARVSYNVRCGLVPVILLFFIIAVPDFGNAADLLHHDIKVTLLPEKQSLRAADTITVPADFPEKFTFLLHSGLAPKSLSPGISLSGPRPAQGGIPLESYTVTLPPGIRSFKIEYAGKIFHPIESVGKEQARGFNQTPGSISGEGIYLAGSSGWYPLVETEFISFTLTAQVPEGWDALSQGTRMLHEKSGAGVVTGWDSPDPQDEIYLISSRFSVYEKASDKVTALVFLRAPDETLAGKYLEATLRYIGMYDRLIGPYPYKKFALVENFWETGFGMPSFTLLGPTVIRLPFIINTSYPHEILHNWWGNSVYPDYTRGNWSEGLTAYLADHLLKEQQGEGREYRLNTLQKYSDYVSTNRDFPLADFISRHSSSTEAVGYGKALMFFHMLRQDLGDKAFIAGLRHFYQTRKFQIATFVDVRKSFEEISGRNLEHEFKQWITQAGAPKLQLKNVRAAKKQDHHIVTGELSQVQSGKPYRLNIPVAVTLEGREKAFQTVLNVTSDKTAVSITVPTRPLRLDVDPEFDVFRHLDKDEMPPAVTQILGAQSMLIVLPSSSGENLLAGYRLLAKSLSESGPDEVDVKFDSELKQLPNDRAITILGWDNKFLETMLNATRKYAVTITDKEVRIGKSSIPRKDHSVVLTARNPDNKDIGFMFVAADRFQALPGLARKLPHYHKYSYLGFQGTEPSNIVKGRWDVVDSPMTVFLPGKDGAVRRVESGHLASREALASLPPVHSAERMMETVKYLASDKLEGREIGGSGADTAAEYIAAKFRQAGLMPGGDNDGYFQTWKESADPKKRRNRSIRMKNVIGLIPGKKPEFAGQSVVIGAHYDHLGFGESLGRTEHKGSIHPGADDNASGIAVLVELAASLKESLKPDRSIVFVAFTGEEHGRLGSAYYAKNYIRYPVSKCIAMVNLDTVGRLGGKKLLVLNAESASEWEHIFRGAGFVTGVDIDVVTGQFESSDQESFERSGVPAVQLFTGPHPDYHRPSDVPDRTDGAGLVRVAAVAKEAVEYLAGRDRPLTAAIGAASGQRSSEAVRKVSLGTMPDFSYSGKGVRLAGVIAGSPAETAGLKEGDVITSVGGSAVSNLAAFSDILKRLKPGDAISIGFIRGGEVLLVETQVKDR